MATPRQKLSPKQYAFIEEIVAHPQLGANHAAEKAGYDKTAGSRLMKHPAIAAEVERRRAELRKETDYDVKAAMREAEEAMDFSRQTRNANAYVKAVELRSKLMGLLVEKMDVRQLTNFRINILGMPGTTEFAKTPEQLINVDGIAHVPMLPNPHREDDIEAEVIDDAQFEDDIFGL
jgi:hypothetical protein